MRLFHENAIHPNVVQAKRSFGIIEDSHFGNRLCYPQLLHALLVNILISSKPIAKRLGRAIDASFTPNPQPGLQPVTRGTVSRTARQHSQPACRASAVRTMVIPVFV
jgi:hypothetical protein